jgi:opacity protein-like surface antigen
MRQFPQRWLLLLGAALMAAGLAACADKPQTVSGESRKSDSKPWDGSTQAGYTAPDWKQGDRASWEQQLRARNQQQNEYTRTR